MGWRARRQSAAPILQRNKEETSGASGVRGASGARAEAISFIRCYVVRTYFRVLKYCATAVTCASVSPATGFILPLPPLMVAST